MTGSWFRLVHDLLHWERWEELIADNGITVDRPAGSAHPAYPDIIYPLDYGFINSTLASDGSEVDIFVGSSPVGLIGAIFAKDFRRGDEEIKFLHNCGPEDIYLANGFINFDRSLMAGKLILRCPMPDIRKRAQSVGVHRNIARPN